MKINLSPRFKRAYKKLPSVIKDDFDEKIAFFVENPKNKKLHTHKLNGRLQSCLSFSLRDGHRVLFEFSSKQGIDLLDVGPHDKYRRWEK